MHYRVESAALPRSKIFKDLVKALAFAKSLAKQTTHEVKIRIVERSHPIDQLVVYIYNKSTPTDSE